jgi:hypothetical protein
MGSPFGRSNHTEDIHFAISRAVLRGDEQSLSWLSVDVRIESIRAFDLPRSPVVGGNTRLRRGDDLPLARAILPRRHPFKRRDRLRVSKRQPGTQGLHGFGTWPRTPHEIDELGG